MKIKKVSDIINEKILSKSDLSKFRDGSYANDDKSLTDKTFTFLLKLMNWKNQLVVNHWQTLSYAEHKLTDDIVEDITEVVDEIGETTIGTFNRPNIDMFTYEIKNITQCPTKDVLDKIDGELLELIECYDDTPHEGIVALLSDFSAKIKKYIYLTTLEK